MSESTELTQAQESFLDQKGLTKSEWRTLKSVIFPTANNDTEIVMALEYCQSRNLDVFKKPVHLVPMWDSRTRTYKTAVMPGIYEIRTTAARTGEYSGMDSPVWGEIIQVSSEGKDISVPSFCQVTVFRTIKGQRVPFAGPEVYFEEACATKGKTNDLNKMWTKRPRGQLQKCAEAAALRCAFPEELGGIMSAEEMDGQVIEAPAWTPTYTEDDREKFHRLIAESDALGFHVFSKTCPTTQFIDLYGTFPAGNKTKGKEIAKALDEEGRNQLQDVIAQIESNDDESSVSEIWHELSTEIQDYIYSQHLTPELQDLITRMLEPQQEAV